jgi:hypothetical protein
MSAKLIVLILALLLGLQPVTTDLYLPALPAITQGFGAGMGQAQLTLTALLLAFGLSSSSKMLRAAFFASSTVGLAGSTGGTSLTTLGAGRAPSTGNVLPSFRAPLTFGFSSSINESTFFADLLAGALASSSSSVELTEVVSADFEVEGRAGMR